MKYEFDMPIFFEAKEILTNTASVSRAVERGLAPEYYTIGNLQNMLFDIPYGSYDTIVEANFAPYIEVHMDYMVVNDKLSFDDTVAIDVRCTFDVDMFARDYHLTTPYED